MKRVKTDPESKYGLEIMVVAVPEEFLIKNQDLLPGLSRKDKTIICQTDGCDDLFRLYFLIEDFMGLEDQYIVDTVASVMNAIDEQTQDPDPHMDIQFSVLTGDANTNMNNIALDEKMNRVASMM